MELFIRNLDPHITENDLKSFVGSLLAVDSVQTFDVRKTRAKGCAILTIADVSKAQHFLRRYEQDRGAACFRVMNKQIYFSISRNSPDPWLLKVLQKNEKDRLLRLQSDQKRNKSAPLTPSTSVNLRLRALSCGRWMVHGSTLQYVAFGSDEFHGALNGNKYPRTRYEVLMDFYDIQSIAVNPVAGQTNVTITLGVAPKIYTRESEPEQDLNSMLKALFVDVDVPEPTKYRSRKLGSVS
jgi:RNA recognition motif-containing protein